MTTISPLLQNRLNSTSTTGTQQAPNNRHEKIYQDLQKKAHEAKPNEAKAKMVDEGIIGNPITATKDTFKDGANFVKAVRTGNMGDNNLGRMNDLGLKVGAGLIATYLAAHSKNKTEALMRFIGGGTFIAAMSLWPKLFINLPARLVHGFRIDRKYVSAQGDKKDFFLDNQFLVWDAYPEEQLRKDAKNAGIDYDSKNGKEKIQRKMQKTALQNRTLWMATAGFATPLMTAMVGNFVEPKVKNAVVKHDLKKAKANIDKMPEVIANAKVDAKEKETILSAIDQLKPEENCLSKENIKNQDGFFAKLEALLAPKDVKKAFKDSDDAKSVANMGTYRLRETLAEVYQETATVKVADLKSRIEGKIRELEKEASETISIFEDLNGGALEATTNGSEVKSGLEGLLADLAKLGDTEDSTCTIAQAKAILKEHFPEDVDVDDAPFKKVVKEYVDKVGSVVPARIKAGLDMLNPLVGSKAESVYTLEYEKAMDRFFEGFGIKGEALKEIRQADNETVIEKLSKAVRTAVEGKDEAEYGKLLDRLSPNASEKDKQLLKDIDEYVKELQKGLTFESLSQGEINGIDKATLEKLNRAVLGGDPEAGAEIGSVSGLIQSFIKEQKVNIETLTLKPRICAEFERAVAKGKIKLPEEQLNLARKMIYDGTISTVATQASTTEKGVWKNVVDAVFNPEHYTDGIKKEIEALKGLFGTGKVEGYTTVENYLRCPSVEGLVKGAATRMSNNRAWKKIFVPMSIALVAVTLLAQPFFGNIKKEFPEENGGAK